MRTQPDKSRLGICYETACLDSSNSQCSDGKRHQAVGQRPDIIKVWPVGKFSLLPVSVDKALLEHSYIHSFLYQPWMLEHYGGKAELLQQTLSGIQTLFTN